MTTPSDDDVIADALTRLEQPGNALPPKSAEQVSARPSHREQEDERRRSARPARPRVPSLALQSVDPQRRPATATLCEQCPNAVWLVSRRQVTCYCRVMYLTVWSSREPVEILECDGIWIGQQL